jgi:hypothetical protein
MKNGRIAFLLLATFSIPALCHATPGIMKLFLARYPDTEGSQLASCRTCHLPAQENCLNGYAQQLQGNRLDFSAIEHSDGDGDGIVNIDEIRARQLPGSQAQADEIFLFTNRIGAITFNHEKHSLARSYLSRGKCRNCHGPETFPRKFSDNKSWQPVAHPLCKGCHKESGSEKAPTRCFACHDKSNRKLLD